MELYTANIYLFVAAMTVGGWVSVAGLSWYLKPYTSRPTLAAFTLIELGCAVAIYLAW